MGTMVRLCASLPGQRAHLRELAASARVPLSTLLSMGSFSPDSSAGIHTATIEEQIQALKADGHDEVLVGNMCTAFVYSLWEDHYRLAFAAASGRERSSVLSSFFGELSAYRHAIIHNRALGTSKTEVLTLLPAVARGQPVKVTRHGFEALVALLKAELHALSYPE